MTQHVETRAILAGRSDGEADLAPVVHPTTTFALDSVDEGRKMATSTGSTAFYSRYGNPSVDAFERAVADLEGAEAARAFASGMGAMSAIVLGLCSTGDHIVTQNRLYAGTQMLFSAVCPRFGIEVTAVDGTDPDAWEAAIRPGKTMLCIAETPANPRLELVDLERFGAIAGPMCVVDSTFATPLAQRPLEYGVDLVVHSATKAMSGHNDASLGVVAGSQELLDWVWGFAVLQGANASPYDATNGLRGLRTLPVRLARQSDTASKLAEALVSRSEVAEVCYPGLGDFPQAELAQRQLDLPGGLLTIELAGGLEAGRAFVESTKIARLAPSLGGPETLVTHPASTTHVSMFPEEQEAAGIGPGTVRISVGLEHPDDVLADLLAALDACPN